MKKLNLKNVLAIVFVIMISGGGFFTIIKNPIKIAGGLVGGYLYADTSTTIFRKMASGFSEFANRVDIYFVGHDLSVNAYGVIQKIMGKTSVDDVDESNTVVKLKNDYLIFKPSENLEQYEEEINYLERLYSICADEGADFLYVAKPSKNTNNISLLPSYYPTVYSVDAANKISEELKKREVPVLDLEKIIEESSVDKYSLFFQTDHHWLPSTGLWAANRIVSELNARYKYEFDPSILELQLYEVETYENVFAGSQGRRVGEYYVGLDDFDIIYPKFDTNFSVEYFDVDEKREGSFEEAFLFRENLNLEKPLTLETNDYDVYMDGNHALIKIQNHNAFNGEKCLLVLDSYGCVTAPYLALEFAELDCIDIRGFTDIPLENYISDTQPDVVVYMINTRQKLE